MFLQDLLWVLRFLPRRHCCHKQDIRSRNGKKHPRHQLLSVLWMPLNKPSTLGLLRKELDPVIVMYEGYSYPDTRQQSGSVRTAGQRRQRRSRSGVSGEIGDVAVGLRLPVVLGLGSPSSLHPRTVGGVPAAQTHGGGRGERRGDTAA